MQPMKPLTVAVIIPTYNRANLVAEAVESALNQTRLPDQIIVVDDGSTDNTQEILSQYKDPVIRIYQQNTGRAGARNRGLESCKADLICFLDSDDLLTPNSIEIRAHWLEQHSHIGSVSGYVQRVDFDGNHLPQSSYPSISTNLFSHLARYNVIPNSAYMFRREAMPNQPIMDPQLEPYEDWDFLMRLLNNNPFSDILPDTVALYRHHTEMSVPIGAKISQAVVDVQQRIYELERFQHLSNASRIAVYHSHAIARMSGGFIDAAQDSLKRAAQLNPYHPVTRGLQLAASATPQLPRNLIQLRNRLKS